MKQLDFKTTTHSASGASPFKAISFGFYWLVGKWRLYWNYCPECNSFAPKMHSCEVCQGDTRSYFDWNKEVENRWWNRFLQKHGFLTKKIYEKPVRPKAKEHFHPKTKLEEAF